MAGSKHGGLGVNLLQNDGARNGSFSQSNHCGINEREDLLVSEADTQIINQGSEEFRSASSFLSKSSGRYEIDSINREPEDDKIKSQFDSSSSDSSSEETEDEKEIEEDEPTGIKGKIDYLRRRTSIFKTTVPK